MYKIMGNQANIKPAFTFNSSTPAQLRSQVGDDDATSESASVETNTTDIQGAQRGKKRRAFNRPDATETITAMLNVFQTKWDHDKAMDAMENQRIFEVMKKNEDSLSSIV